MECSSSNVLRKMFRLKHLILPYYDKKTIRNYQLRLDVGVDELESLIGFDSSMHELKSQNEESSTFVSINMR